MKRSDFGDDEWGAILQRRWDALAQAHSDGVIDEHPIEGFNRDSAALRTVAKDGLPGNVASSKEIMDSCAEMSADDPPDFPGKPPNPERPGATLANAADASLDLALEELAIRQRASAHMEGELHLARIRRSNAAAVRAMDKLIPGLDRLK